MQRKILKMKTNKTFIILSFILALCGCSAQNNDAYNKRQQMLDAQMASIYSIEIQISKIREANGNDMKKWNADTVAFYKMWQSELINRYKERAELIKDMSVNTSEATH